MSDMKGLLELYKLFLFLPHVLYLHIRLITWKGTLSTFCMVPNELNYTE